MAPDAPAVWVSAVGFGVSGFLATLMTGRTLKGGPDEKNRTATLVSAFEGHLTPTMKSISGKASHPIGGATVSTKLFGGQEELSAQCQNTCSTHMRP